MASGEVEAFADQLAVAVNQDRAAAGSTRTVPTPAEFHMGFDLLPGTRVLDLVTGEKGVVIAGQVAHRLIQPAKPGTAQGPSGSA